METNGKLLVLTCVVHEQEGLVCESSITEAQDICLNIEQNICHFEMHPNETPETVLAYIGKRMCLRENPL